MTTKNIRTFQFNTGVKYSDYPFLSKGQTVSGDAKVIPFNCEDVPQNAKFEFACDDPNLYEGSGYIVREMFNTSMLSKYAYFTTTYCKTYH